MNHLGLRPRWFIQSMILFREFISRANSTLVLQILGAATIISILRSLSHLLYTFINTLGYSLYHSLPCSTP